MNPTRTSPAPGPTSVAQAVFQPRLTTPLGCDADGVKLYSISADGGGVDVDLFQRRLDAVKVQRKLDWSSTPGFAIFHRGGSVLYLIVAWWENQNELFTSVSVKEAKGWVEDPQKYSFCLWDLEVFWYERNCFIAHMYSGSPDLAAYRQDVKPPVAMPPAIKVGSKNRAPLSNARKT
jgi:hypothetical protein